MSMMMKDKHENKETSPTNLPEKQHLIQPTAGNIKDKSIWKAALLHRLSEYIKKMQIKGWDIYRRK